MRYRQLYHQIALEVATVKVFSCVNPCISVKGRDGVITPGGEEIQNWHKILGMFMDG